MNKKELIINVISTGSHKLHSILGACANDYKEEIEVINALCELIQENKVSYNPDKKQYYIK